MKIAFYGTLMRGFGAQRRLGVEALLRYEGPCRIPGLLWDLGAYPGLTAGEESVKGELFTALDPGVLQLLDELEGAEYRRRSLSLLEPRIDAWVYVLAAAPPGRRLIASGCWRTHALRGAESRSD